MPLIDMSFSLLAVFPLVNGDEVLFDLGVVGVLEFGYRKYSIDIQVRFFLLVGIKKVCPK